MPKKFKPAEIAALRLAYDKLDKIDPMTPAYEKLVALLDKMEQPMLRQVRDAKIKFLSKLAINRIKG